MVFSELPHEALYDYEECKDLITLPVRKPEPEETHYFSNVSIADYQQK